MRGRMNNVEKAKNFKDSIRKLMTSLKPYLFIITIAIVLIIISTVCTLIGPNRLSKMTDLIEEGISVNIDLTDEQMATLRTEKEVRIESENFTFLLQFEDYNNQDSSDDLVTVLLEVLAGDQTITQFVGSEKFSVIEENEFVNFSSSKIEGIGIGYQNATLSIWLNTEGKVNIDSVFRLAIFLVILYIVAYFANFFQGFIMATVNQRVSQNLRSAISNKINKLPLKYFDSTSYGEVLSRVTNDVDTIGQALNNSVSTLVGAFALFIGSLIMMFVTNWIMALSGVVATIIGFALMILIISKSRAM